MWSRDKRLSGRCMTPIFVQWQHNSWTPFHLFFHNIHHQCLKYTTSYAETNVSFQVKFILQVTHKSGSSWIGWYRDSHSSTISSILCQLMLPSRNVFLTLPLIIHVNLEVLGCGWSTCRNISTAVRVGLGRQMQIVLKCICKGLLVRFPRGR